MRRSFRGFSLIELMVVVAIIGVLAAIAIPMFMGHTNKAKGTEAVLQLEVLAKNATIYHMTNGRFPVGTAAVLPAPDGDACKASSRTMTATRAWNSDPMWAALGFYIGEATRFSYHYQATGPHSARAWATADLGCSGKLVTYELVMEGRCSGSVAWVLIDPTSRNNQAAPAPSADCGTSGGGSTTGGGDGSTTGGGGGTTTGGGDTTTGGGGTAGGGGSTTGGGSTSGGGSTGGGGSTSGGGDSSGGGGSTGGGGGSTGGGGGSTGGGGGGSAEDPSDDPSPGSGSSGGASSGGGGGSTGGGSTGDDDDHHDDDDKCVPTRWNKCKKPKRH